MITTRYASAQDAQRAFYAAFERADLAAMMAVWAQDEQVVCVHPAGARNTGLEEVRQSWRQIFAAGPQLKFSLIGEFIHPGKTLSVHNLYEHVTVIGDPRPVTPLLATNIYLLTEHGWRMLLHHASPLAAVQAAQEPLASKLH